MQNPGTMKWFALVLVVGGLLGRWAMVSMDDTALRDDVLFSEMLTSTHGDVKAASMVPILEKAIRDRHYELVPDTMRVDVGDSREGTLKIQGAGLQVAGKGPVRVQDIDIRFTCRRPGVFFAKTAVVYHVQTQAPGDGGANHWPAGDGATQ